MTKEEWIFPHLIFYGSRPPLPLLPFTQPVDHRVTLQRKREPRSHLYYFINFGYNHGRDCYKLLDAETGKFVFSRDVTWHHPDVPLILPATAVGNPLAAPPQEIYVTMPTPVSRCESLVLYRIMYGNRAMKVQPRNNFVVGSDYTEILGS